MTNTPLNPDALEASAAAARIDWSGRTDWNGAPNSVQIAYRKVARAAVSAYLASAQPEVNSYDPRELNRKGWTCGCEPGDYDKCEGCQSACDELADFLNRLEDTK